MATTLVIRELLEQSDIKFFFGTVEEPLEIRVLRQVQSSSVL
jgi:hypothetical protein